MGVRASAPLRRKRGSEAPSPSAEGPLELAIISDPGEDLCGNQPVCRAGDGVAALVPSSGEEPTPPRHRAGVAVNLISTQAIALENQYRATS